MLLVWYTPQTVNSVSLNSVSKCIRLWVFCVWCIAEPYQVYLTLGLICVVHYTTIPNVSDFISLSCRFLVFCALHILTTFLWCVVYWSILSTVTDFRSFVCCTLHNPSKCIWILLFCVCCIAQSHQINATLGLSCVVRSTTLSNVSDSLCFLCGALKTSTKSICL